MSTCKYISLDVFVLSTQTFTTRSDDYLEVSNVVVLAKRLMFTYYIYWWKFISKEQRSGCFY